MDYSSEPPYSKLLKIQGTEPLNAEPPSSALVEFPITPDKLVYCRNHGPVRVFDETYTVTIDASNGKKLELRASDLKEMFEVVEVEAVLQCAGNRRREMSAIKPVSGILWLDGTIANCRWGGVRLCDVLKHVGLTDDGSTDGKHVCFTSYATLCQDDKYYGASIPLSRALLPEADVLLAFEMNGEPLPAHHGGPLRLVVPGFLGARWVKWLDGISISSEESPNYYQQRDYKVLPPTVGSKAEAAPIWKNFPSMTSMPLNSIIASISPLSLAPTRSILVKGYATHGPSAAVSTVEASVDDGETWQNAEVVYRGGKWGWVIWEAELELTESHAKHVLCRAKDETGVYQPKEGIWNLRGVAWCGWGKHKIEF